MSEEGQTSEYSYHNNFTKSSVVVITSQSEVLNCLLMLDSEVLTQGL